MALLEPGYTSLDTFPLFAGCSGLTEGLGVSIESLVGRSPLREIIVRSCKVDREGLLQPLATCAAMADISFGVCFGAACICRMLIVFPVTFSLCRTPMLTFGRAGLRWWETWPRRARHTSSPRW